MIPQIPVLIDMATVKRYLEKIRTTINPLQEAFVLVLTNPTFKFRLNATGDYLTVEYARRVSVPGMEKWATAIRGNIVSGLPVYATNAAALAGGLVAGDFYHTGADPDPLCVVH